MADGIGSYLPGLNNVVYDSAGRAYEQRYGANGKSDLYAKRELTLQQKMLLEAQASPENYAGSIGELGGFLPTGQPLPPTVAMQPSRLAPVAAPAPQPAPPPAPMTAPAPSPFSAPEEPVSIGTPTPSAAKPITPITQAEWLASGQIPALTQSDDAILRQVRAENPNASEKDIQMQVKKAMANDAEKQFLYKSILDINRKPPTRDELYATVSQQVRAANPDASERDIQMQVNKAMALAPSITSESTATAAPTGNAVLDELNKQKTEYDRYSWPEMLRKGQAAGVPMENIIAKYNELQKVRPPALTAEQEKIRYEAINPAMKKMEAKDLTDMSLLAKSLQDKLGRPATAQELLDAEQQRKMEVAGATANAKVAAAASAPTKYYEANKETVAADANSVINGKAELNQFLGGRETPRKQAVRSSVISQYPDFNFLYAAANYNKMKDPKNSAIINNVSAIDKRMSSLEEKAANLKNTDFLLPNKISNWFAMQTGNPRVRDFESFKTSIMLEATQAMTGGVPTDIRFEAEMKNIQAGDSPEALKAALANLRNALNARKEAALDIPHPWAEVKGLPASAITKPYSQEEVKGVVASRATMPAPTASAASGGTIMAEMPDAAQHSGRTIVDDTTGKRLKSDGRTWVEVR